MVSVACAVGVELPCRTTVLSLYLSSTHIFFSFHSTTTVGDGAAATDVIDQALSVHPQSPDAFNALALRKATTYEEALTLYALAEKYARENLPSPTWLDDAIRDGDLCGCPALRPLFRAIHGENERVSDRQTDRQAADFVLQFNRTSQHASQNGKVGGSFGKVQDFDLV